MHPIPVSLRRLRNTAAELLAAALCELFPEVQLVEGGTCSSGFYYTVFLSQSLGDSELAAVEERMRVICQDNRPIETKEMLRSNSINFLLHRNQPLRAQAVATEPEDLVQQFIMGDFVDIGCGPFLSRSGELTAFRLTGTEACSIHDGKPGVRVLGAAFASQKELKQNLRLQTIEKKRDHRKVAVEAQLLTFLQQPNHSCWLWQPKGAFVRQALHDWWIEACQNEGFALINSDQAIFDSYQQQHGLIFGSLWHSYRQMPVRFAELGQREHTNFRNERGVMRSQRQTCDQFSAFCTSDQALDQLVSFLHFQLRGINLFDLGYRVFIGDRSPRSPLTRIQWEKGVRLLHEAVEAAGLKATEQRGSSAIVPTLELVVVDSLGREWPGPLCMINELMPNQLGLRYQDRVGEMRQPIMIVGSFFRSIERFFALLVEHGYGCFPLWLAPEQVRIIAVTDDQVLYSKQVLDQLQAAGIRASIDHRADKLGAKIRLAQIERIPYTVVLGKREQEKTLVTVRAWNQAALSSNSSRSWIASLKEEVVTKRGLRLEQDFEFEN